MSKVIVFDLDDTIGHFKQLSGLDWYLKKIYGKIVTRKHFNEILDLFPKIFRPRIFEIIEYIKKEKKRRKDIKVMIYTNNTGCKMWVHRIKSYIEKKIKYKIFDRVICGWKYDGKIIEPNRSGWDKKYTDLLRCGHLTYKDEILFLDDQYHEDMFHKKVTYLQLKPYIYNYPYKHMIMKYKSIADLSKKQQFLFNKKIQVTKNNNCRTSVNLKEFNKIGYVIEKQVKNFLSKHKQTRKQTRKQTKTQTKTQTRKQKK